MAEEEINVKKRKKNKVIRNHSKTQAFVCIAKATK